MTSETSVPVAAIPMKVSDAGNRVLVQISILCVRLGRRGRCVSGRVQSVIAALLCDKDDLEQS